MTPKGGPVDDEKRLLVTEMYIGRHILKRAMDSGAAALRREWLEDNPRERKSGCHRNHVGTSMMVTFHS